MKPSAEERRRLVSDVTHKALTAEDPREIWRFLAERLTRFFDCERATIFQKDSRGRLVSRYAHGLPEPITLELGEGIAGHVASSGKPHLSNDPYADPRFDRRLDQATGFLTRSLLAYPLIYRGEPAGVLELLNKEGGFGTPELEALKELEEPIVVVFVKTRFDEDREDFTRQLLHIEKMAALGRLASAVAHEVNNPLTAILGFAELLMRTPGMPPEALEKLLRIDADVRRIQAITGQLLGFARAGPQQFERIDLAQILDESLELARPELHTRRVSIARDCRPAPPVMGDRNQLKQVFLNLLINAAQALDGRPERRVAVRVYATRETCVAEVADNGPGIPPAQRQQIFEPFFTTKGDKGTGLGLYVSAGIVEKHRGRITVATAPEGGALFRMEFPPADQPRL